VIGVGPCARRAVDRPRGRDRSPAPRQALGLARPALDDRLAALAPPIDEGPVVEVKKSERSRRPLEPSTSTPPATTLDAIRPKIPWRRLGHRARSKSRAGVRPRADR
jgi:hypothetical protein